jgi:hypothetical protein
MHLVPVSHLQVGGAITLPGPAKKYLISLALNQAGLAINTLMNLHRVPRGKYLKYLKYYLGQATSGDNIVGRPVSMAIMGDLAQRLQK